MPFRIKIPDLKIKFCAECSKNLSDQDFLRIGVTCAIPSEVFFEYRCPSCFYDGCWSLSITEGPDNPIDALKILTRIMQVDQNKQRGIVSDQLNKMYGLDDLLKLGGKNAPREPKIKRDP